MSPEPSIAGAIAKIDRADENIRNLGGQFAAFLDKHPYTAVRQHDDDPKARVFKITSVSDVPLPLRVLVGEIAHHLRSAFDLLVYQLMLKANVSDPKRLEQCAFPVLTDIYFTVADDRKKYKDTLRRKIEGIDPRAATRIEQLQPCNGHRVADSFLAQIDDLDNTDKHRLLLALIGSVQIAGFNFPNPDGTVVTVPHRALLPLEPDAIVRVAPVEPDVDVDPKLPLEIAFGESGILLRQPVIPTLQNLSDIARQTIVFFDRYF